MATKKVLSVLERFEKVATAHRLPPHAELEDLAEIANDMRGDLEELLEALEDFCNHVETLVDDNNDRDDRREARDELPDNAQTIFDKLDTVSAHTVAPVVGGS